MDRVADHSAGRFSPLGPLCIGPLYLLLFSFCELDPSGLKLIFQGKMHLDSPDYDKNQAQYGHPQDPPKNVPR
jgi:hypothetical protein